jgi:hypothetical protein
MKKPGSSNEASILIEAKENSPLAGRPARGKFL